MSPTRADKKDRAEIEAHLAEHDIVLTDTQFTAQMLRLGMRTKLKRIRGKVPK